MDMSPSLAHHHNLPHIRYHHTHAGLQETGPLPHMLVYKKHLPYVGAHEAAPRSQNACNL